MTDHFKPLWSKNNAPRFGIAHAMALGLGPWLEIPEMIEKGVVTYTGKNVICFGQIKLFFGIDTLLLTELQQKRRQSCFLKVFFFFPIFVFFLLHWLCTYFNPKVSAAKPIFDIS